MAFYGLYSISHIFKYSPFPAPSLPHPALIPPLDTPFAFGEHVESRSKLKASLSIFIFCIIMFQDNIENYDIFSVIIPKPRGYETFFHAQRNFKCL